MLTSSNTLFMICFRYDIVSYSQPERNNFVGSKVVYDMF